MEFKPGAPSKFTAERCEMILKSIARRVPYSLAAEANGIHEDTLANWIKRAKEDIKAGIDSDYAQFFGAIRKIEQERVMEHSDSISTRPKNWQADAWLLERRWRKLYGADAFEQEVRERLEKIETQQRQGSSDGISEEMDSKGNE